MTLVADILKREEGFRGKPYLCTAGHVTIGYGRNLDANPLTEAEATVLLENDIAKAATEAGRFAWFHGLNEVRQAVVISMIFQLGAQSFRKFATTIKYIEAGDYDSAADQMLRSLWASQTPARAGRMAQMMRYGK